METTNTTRKENYFLNHFDALNSARFSEEFNKAKQKFNTDALINIFSSYHETADKEWLEGAIESALEEEDEAKQIFNLAESIRIEYLSGSISAVDEIYEAIQKTVDKNKRYRLEVIIDYLMSSLYEIDLFDVAKELILRYRSGTQMKTELELNNSICEQKHSA
ncbi:MAG TPA: hypothetical protein DHV28_17695 [Ignavibacteriales bacterium]|nr:hypothetical protein [Ignavibacteriales bacterium]